MPQTNRRVFAVFGFLSAASCAPATSDSATTEDSTTALQTYWADAKKLDLGDLSRVAVGFATNKLNDDLATGGFVAKLEPTSVYAIEAQDNKLLPAGDRVKSLDTIVTSLTAGFGENELSTQVNQVRLSYLKRANGYYIESGFTLNGELAHNWSFDAAGLGDGSSISLGFRAGADLDSRIIIPTDDSHLGSLLSAPVKAIAAARGFVYPRSLDDIRTMAPGEMFALRGVGTVGANFGVGVPIHAGGVVVSAGVSAIVGGQLDVQLVRMEGDEVVVEVGVENGVGTAFHASVSDAYGIKGICDDAKPCLRTVDLGVAKVDLQHLVEKAVERRVNAYLTINAQASASIGSSRVGIMRMHFHLDGGDSVEIARALEQALHADVRLAQALYNRDLGRSARPVTIDYDLLRAATTSTRSFGVQAFGMNVFQRSVVEKHGSFVVQTPDGTSSVLFDMVNKHTGWFQKDHGFARTGLGALTIDAKNPAIARSEANLFLQTAVGDSHMDDDSLIDNADALIGALAGASAVEALDAYGNELERTVWDTCPVQQDSYGQTKPWDEKCNVDLLDRPIMKDLKAKGMAAIEAHIGSLPEGHKQIVRDTAGLRLTLQSVGIHNLDALNGPNASLTLDVRFDDRALAALTAAKTTAFRTALVDYLTAVSADRRAVGATTDKKAVRDSVEAQWSGDIDAMASIFEQTSAAYGGLARVEHAIPNALAGKRYSGDALDIQFEVDGSQSSIYESAIAQSLAHERAQVGARLFDDLRDRATRLFGLPLYAEEAVVYPLLSLVPARNNEVGLDVRADVKSTFWVARERYKKAGFTSLVMAARGADVSTITAGMFDLNGIINGTAVAGSP